MSFSGLYKTVQDIIFLLVAQWQNDVFQAVANVFVFVNVFGQ